MSEDVDRFGFGGSSSDGKGRLAARFTARSQRRFNHPSSRKRACRISVQHDSDDRETPSSAKEELHPRRPVAVLRLKLTDGRPAIINDQIPVHRLRGLLGFSADTPRCALSCYPP